MDVCTLVRIVVSENLFYDFIISIIVTKNILITGLISDRDRPMCLSTAIPLAGVGKPAGSDPQIPRKKTMVFLLSKRDHPVRVDGRDAHLPNGLSGLHKSQKHSAFQPAFSVIGYYANGILLP